MYYAGFVGEANSTYLKMEITDFISDNFAFAALVFKNGYNEINTIRLKRDALSVTEQRYYIELPLTYELTKSNKLDFVTAFYNQDNDKIVRISKSPILKLQFENSLNPNDVMADDKIYDIYKELFELEKRFNVQISNADDATKSANEAAAAANSLVNDIRTKLESGEFTGDKGDTGAPGTTLYSELTDKPSINGHILTSGNQTSEQLGLQRQLNSNDKMNISLAAVDDNVISAIRLFSGEKINNTYLSKKTAAYMHPIFQVDDLMLGRLVQSGHISSTTTRYSSAIFNNTLYCFDYDVAVRVSEGYMFSIYSAPDADSEALERLCYQTTEKFTVPANTYFRFWIEKVGATALSKVFSSPSEAYSIIIMESSYLENALAGTTERVDALEAKVDALDVSGKKHWSLLIEHTISEEVAVGSFVDFAADADGEPYAVHEALLEVTFPAALPGTLAFQVNGNSANAVSWEMIPKGTQKAVIHIKFLLDNLIEYEYRCMQSGIHSLGTFEGVNYLRILQNISFFRLRSRAEYGSIPIPSGTQIKIWASDYKPEQN